MGDKRAAYRSFSSPLSKCKLVATAVLMFGVVLVLLFSPFNSSNISQQQEGLQSSSSSAASAVLGPSPSGTKEQHQTKGVTVTSKTDPSFQIFLYPPEQDIISKKIFESGVYEPDETEFIRQVGGNGWAVDIGANVGFHTLHMGALGLDVICFEPSPDTASLLRQSIAANTSLQNRIRLYEAAAAEEPGTGRLVRHPDSPGMTILTRIGDDLSQLPFGVTTTASLNNADITLVRPESILAKHIILPTDENSNSKLRLLKVDAEGHELHAFRGVNLERFPFAYIAFELFPELLWKAGQTDPLDLLLFLQQFGYVCTTTPMKLFTDTLMDQKMTDEQLRTWYQDIIQAKYQFVLRASVIYPSNTTGRGCDAFVGRS